MNPVCCFLNPPPTSPPPPLSLVCGHFCAWLCVCQFVHLMNASHPFHFFLYISHLKTVNYYIISFYIYFLTPVLSPLPPGPPQPPQDVQVLCGQAPGVLQVRWKRPILSPTGTSNGANVVGYAVCTKGQRVSKQVLVLLTKTISLC